MRAACGGVRRGDLYATAPEGRLTRALAAPLASAGRARPGPLREGPHAFDGFAEDPLTVVGVEELHVVAHDGERFIVGRLRVFEDRPVGGPHQSLGAEGVV